MMNDTMTIEPPAATPATNATSDSCENDDVLFLKDMDSFDIALPEQGIIVTDDEATLSNTKANTAFSPKDMDALDIPLPEQGFVATDDEVTLSNNKTAPELIAETLDAMSFKDREQVIRQVHGIVESTEETPEFVQERLKEMDSELQRLKSKSFWSLRFAAIEMAESQCKQFVQSPKFRIRFLRCDSWNPTKAASRFVRYFDWKLELFGEEVLGRDLRLTDLQPQDVKMMKKGYMQRLPVRDRAGRAVNVALFNGQEYESLQSLCRQLFYMGSYADEETDKLGTVSVNFKVRNITFKNSPSIWASCANLYRFWSDLPVRVEAIHKCLEPGFSRGNFTETVHAMVDRAVSMMVPDLRARTKTHYGSYDDWAKELMAFGIPLDLIPVTKDLKLKTKNHLEYLAMRQKEEEMALLQPNMQNFTTSLPCRHDVLLGKGRPIQFFTGNQRLATFIDGCLDQYSKGSKTEKTALAAEIVTMAKANHVKFLSKESSIWMEVSDHVARDKVSHMFRHQRTRESGNIPCRPEKASFPHSNDHYSSTIGLIEAKRVKV